jgi:hypothetical protein
MKESIIPRLLTASSQLAAFGRKSSQIALNNYAVCLAGTDIRLWEIILDTTRSGGNEDMLQQSYLRLRDSYAALPDPDEAARRLAKLEKDVPRSVSDVLDRIDLLTLPAKDPVWRTMAVTPGATILIEAATEYYQVENNQNRSAVLLIKGLDKDGNPINAPCGKLARSAHLKSYFKYLPDTRGKVRELHRFTVPEGVSRLCLGSCAFNRKHEAEQIVLRPLIVRKLDDKAQVTPFTPPSPQAAEISILGWPDYPPNGKPYVIGIMDEFTTGCFGQELNLLQPRPDNWYALAEKYPPVMFFIESAWKGNSGSWQFRVAEYSNKPGQEIAHICEYARQKGIPTLFLNKEDPVHHEKFMCSARLADHIFTTDANMIASYVSRTGNRNVHALPFAAQPALHKPAPLEGRIPRSCFAGSWYGNRHAERGQEMGWLLQAANRHGLDIFDRNFGTGNFSFPDEFRDGIRGSLPYAELCAEYRRYRVFLNVNSVTNSPTMFSRRVFELMACGTPVVSTWAKGIEELFESDAVWMVRDKAEAEEAIRTLLTDPTEWRRRSLAGIREVFARHTYAHRLNEIFGYLGLDHHIPTNPRILLLAHAADTRELARLNSLAEAQSYHNFQLGIICQNGLAAVAGSLNPNLMLLVPGETKGWLATQADASALAGWISSNHGYGTHYLQDLVNASRYAPEAAGWAKSSDRDRFAYDGPAKRGGTLWSTAAFHAQPLNADPHETLTIPEVYLADSDQFQPGAAQFNDIRKG